MIRKVKLSYVIETGRIFIEFQGYNDPFIRHRLMAEVFWGCAGENYKGSVMAGIVYTDKKYQKAAEPLNAFDSLEEECHLKGCLREVVLTDYTEKELEAIDPKLIILAPFTLSSKTDKTTLLAKGRKWQQALTQRLPVEQKHEEVLSVLGLFILNRFRKITYEEVIAMLKFDLMDTVAGRQLYEMGLQKGHGDGLQDGLQAGLKNARENAEETLLEVLNIRFGIVPNDIIEKIRATSRLEMLKHLIIQATLSSDLENFKGSLSYH
ncbi:DUF2887 domain-containing protein [Candidatus Marithioploca araucensis]|uniref:DUF2887 domain-containing protein n=1 Tax=Candidatus Marithioploca araucensis TaxID=70273 RepID=A0ABT7VTE3_9GAMM|nr:DUF2887 domain-containing protein [Candidatus Marithioploca araucensis]